LTLSLKPSKKNMISIGGWGITGWWDKDEPVVHGGPPYNAHADMRLDIKYAETHEKT